MSHANKGTIDKVHKWLGHQTLGIPVITARRDKSIRPKHRTSGGLPVCSTTFSVFLPLQIAEMDEAIDQPSNSRVVHAIL
jgi:hypothetical protein